MNKLSRALTQPLSKHLQAHGPAGDPRRPCQPWRRLRGATTCDRDLGTHSKAQTGASDTYGEHGFCPEEVLGEAWHGGRPAQGWNWPSSFQGRRKAEWPRRHRFDGQGNEGRAPVADDRHQGHCLRDTSVQGEGPWPATDKGSHGCTGVRPRLGIETQTCSPRLLPECGVARSLVGPLLPRSKDQGLGEGERPPWAWTTPCHRHRQDQLWRQWLTTARPGRVLCLSLRPARDPGTAASVQEHPPPNGGTSFPGPPQ